jgi:hypothetical protein
MSLRCVFVAAMLSLSASGSQSHASTQVFGWAYRCTDESTVVYLAVRADSFLQLDFDLDTANMLLTPQGGSTQAISLDDVTGFRTGETGELTVAEFDAIPDVVRAGLESDDNIIQGWIEVTIPALVDGTQYTFSANGPRLLTAPVNSWVTIIECGDDTPPVLDCVVGETLLWPPNHQLVNVGLELLELSDDQDPAPTTEIFVYSDEAVNDTGDGNTEEDAVDVDFDTLQLRAERSGNGDGRVYLIVIVATDASENETVACHTVVVPKSLSRKDRDAVEDQAALAELLCDDDDALTTIGFSLIGTSIDF